MTYSRRACCPCCGFSTLNENCGFEICVICWWEDDGQNDHNADEVRGGPNSHYSLTNARNNFAAHGHMYDMGQEILAVKRPSKARSALMDYIQSIGFEPQRADVTRLGELLDAEEEEATTMKKSKSGSQNGPEPDSTSPLSDWRGEMLARVRTLIRQADPEVVEDVKWRKPSNSMRGVPVWSHDGIICTGEMYKNAVKLTFAKGASLEDPARLFNASLEGNTRRAIDLHEGDKIDERALKELIRVAVALNTSARETARPVRSAKKPKSV